MVAMIQKEGRLTTVVERGNGSYIIKEETVKKEVVEMVEVEAVVTEEMVEEYSKVFKVDIPRFADLDEQIRREREELQRRMREVQAEIDRKVQEHEADFQQFCKELEEKRSLEQASLNAHKAVRMAQEAAKEYRKQAVIKEVKRVTKTVKGLFR